jgi:protein-S-isoprenylcysteine O-methyltransferase Ste14
MAETGDPMRTPGDAQLLFAWLGGAAFVSSLAYFLYVYGVEWGYVTSPHWAAPAAIDVALFTVFALHHSILARTSAKRIVTLVVPAWMERSLFTWVASLLFIVVLIAWQPVGDVLYRWPAPWAVAGYAVQLAGIILTALGSSAIDVLDLAGIRPVLDAREHHPPRHVALKTDGVYALVRHPLYFGWLLLVFGAPAMTGTRLVFAIISSVYLVIAIPFEERALVDVFEEAYRDYQRRTRFRLLPGVW